MSALKDMPVVTVEQIIRFREKAMDIETQLKTACDVLFKVQDACLWVDDDGNVMVSEDVVISSELFDEMNSVLSQRGEIK